MLVSTKMVKPSGAFLSGLIPIFYLVDELLNLGMFPESERAEGVIYNTMGFLAAARSRSLQGQSYNFFSLRLAFGQQARQSIRHMDFYRSHWENLLGGNSKVKGDSGQVV